MKYRLKSDREVVVRHDYKKEIIFSPSDFVRPEFLLQILTIPPNTKQRLHFHKKQTEVYFVLEGKALVYVDKREFTAYPGDAFMSGPHEMHYLWNQSNKEFKLAVFKFDIPKEEDTEWVGKGKSESKDQNLKSKN